MIDPALMEILVCPKCRSRLALREESGGQGAAAWLECQSAACGLRYPVREGIPVMLIDEARPPAGSRPAGGVGS